MRKESAKVIGIYYIHTVHWNSSEAFGRCVWRSHWLFSGGAFSLVELFTLLLHYWPRQTFRQKDIYNLVAPVPSQSSCGISIASGKDTQAFFSAPLFPLLFQRTVQCHRTSHQGSAVGKVLLGCPEMFASLDAACRALSSAPAVSRGRRYKSRPLASAQVRQWLTMASHKCDDELVAGSSLVLRRRRPGLR